MSTEPVVVTIFKCHTRPERERDLALDGAEDVEALARAAAAVVERVAARRDRLRSAGLDAILAQRADLAGHDAREVALERQARHEREQASRVDEHAHGAPPLAVV